MAAGLVWERDEYLWRRATSALLTYRELHGDLRVPRDFEVPRQEPWERLSWGLRLGLTVNSIRRPQQNLVRDKPERREWLDGIGFESNQSERMNQYC